MKKTSIALALLAAGTVALPAAAKDTPKHWVGGYGMYYSTDAGKPMPAAQLDDGFGIGGEAGFRFDDNWAARISATYLDIDGVNGGSDESGPMVGLDAMYFFNDDLFYVFGGLYHEELDDDYQMLGYGLGKHWAVSDKLSIITELAGYRDFSESLYDVSAKVGISYSFGSVTRSTYTAPAPAAPAPAMAAPADSDKDGIIDRLDRCPGTPMGTPVDDMGCDADKDKDGVLNGADQCPDTPVGASVDNLGCTIELDSDFDGVLDSKDICPDTPTGDQVHPNGCTIFTDKTVSIEVRILFANNSAEIEDIRDPQIVELATFLKRYGKTNAIIEGHSSAPGAAAYNKDLSLRRANALKAVLVKDYDIDMSRLTAVGYGEERLIDTANTREAHNINRRIEVQVSETISVPKQ